MSGVAKAKRSRYGSQIRVGRVRIKTRIFRGDASGGWRLLKAEKHLKAGGKVADFLLDRKDPAMFG